MDAMADDAGVLRFAPLEVLPWLTHGFVLRTPAVEVACGRGEALARLADSHVQALRRCGVEPDCLALCGQVHGAEVAFVDAVPEAPVPGCDALATNRAGLALGIHVADCCPVWLVDVARRAIALAHSGRKGTELGIVPACIRSMCGRFGSEPADILAVLGPCIRPPLYEVDIARDIAAQCANEGVAAIHDCGHCTGSDLERFYSYRVERGQTGRMLAFAMVGGKS